jgi:hypothetical protein
VQRAVSLVPFSFFRAGYSPIAPVSGAVTSGLSPVSSDASSNLNPERPSKVFAERGCPWAIQFIQEILGLKVE